VIEPDKPTTIFMSATLFSNPRRRFLLVDLVLGTLVILIAGVFNDYADRILLASWIITFGYLLLTRRFDSLVHQFLATTIAMLWVHFAREYYGYKFSYLVVYGMNTMPLLAWAMAILVLGEICNHLELPGKQYDLLVFTILFWFFLIVFETVAYHVLGLRNTMTGNFAGLPFCNCIHAPAWMKVVYFSMGPFYYGLTKLADQLLRRRFSGLLQSGYGSKS
jgi:hypothetical protein